MKVGLVLLFFSLCAASSSFVVSSGRYRDNQDASVSFDWSGITIAFALQCSSSGDSPSLLINASSSSASTEQGSHTFRFLAGSSLGNVGLKEFDFSHVNVPVSTNVVLSPVGSQRIVVKMVKITEALFGVFTLYSVSSSNCVVSAPTEAELRAGSGLSVEFIGDSLTCGYGVLGTSPCRCAFFVFVVVSFCLQEKDFLRRRRMSQPPMQVCLWAAVLWDSTASCPGLAKA